MSRPRGGGRKERQGRPRQGTSSRKGAEGGVLRPLDYFRAAEQRLAAAKYLLVSGAFNLDAYYLAGYAIESAMKALILNATPVSRRKATSSEISRGSSMHDYLVLKDRLDKLHRMMPLDLAKRLRGNYWSPDLRYRSGLGSSFESGEFVQTAQDLVGWIEGAF